MSPCQEWSERAVGGLFANIQLEIQRPEAVGVLALVPWGTAISPWEELQLCTGLRGRGAAHAGKLDQITGNKKS